MSSICSGRGRRTGRWSADRRARARPAAAGEAQPEFIRRRRVGQAGARPSLEPAWRDLADGADRGDVLQRRQPLLPRSRLNVECVAAAIDRVRVLPFNNDMADGIELDVRSTCRGEALTADGNAEPPLHWVGPDA